MESSSICARDRKYYYDTYVIRLLYLDCEFWCIYARFEDAKMHEMQQNIELRKNI